MNLKFKYLAITLGIILYNNYNNTSAMEIAKERNNTNEIIINENNDIINTTEYTNTEDDNFLKVNLNNKDSKAIGQLITQPVENIPQIEFLNEYTYGSLTLYKRFRHKHYGKNEISDLLLSFNNWDKNKPLTFNQLKEIYNITKTVKFFLNKEQENSKKKKTSVFGCCDFYFSFAIEDENFGVALNKQSHDSLLEEKKHNKFIFIPNNNEGLFLINELKNKSNKIQDIDSKNFIKFLDAVKLCSTKKLPIVFKDKNNKEYKNPYLITKDDYEFLVNALMKDFWFAFCYGYRDKLRSPVMEYENIFKEEANEEYEKIKSSEEYENLKKEDKALRKKIHQLCNKLKKIEHELEQKNIFSFEILKNKEYGIIDEKILAEHEKLYQISDKLNYYNDKTMLNNITNAFENNYNESNFIKIFGKDVINNIRYIIYHLIDIKMHSNNNSLLNKTNEYLEKILCENAIEYDDKAIKGSKLVNIIINDLLYYINNNNNELKNRFDNLKEIIWKNENISNLLNNELRNTFKKSEEELKQEQNNFFIIETDNDKKLNQYKLNKQKVCDYLGKLLYDQAFNQYLKEKLIIRIKASKINEKFLQHLFKRKNIHNKLSTKINSFLYSYDIKDVEQSIKQSILKKHINK